MRGGHDTMSQPLTYTAPFYFVAEPSPVPGGLLRQGFGTFGNRVKPNFGARSAMFLRRKSAAFFRTHADERWTVRSS